MTRSMRWIQAICAIVSITSSASNACAEGLRVLFVTSSSTPFSERVRAEIEAMGFDIEPATGLSGDATTSAVAAARVVEIPARRVELWIADPTTRKLTLRALVMPSPDGDDAVETVRASEQLRAFFQPLRERPSPPSPPPRPSPPSPTEPPSPRPATAPIAPPWSRFILGADLAVPFQPGGPGLDLALRGLFAPTQFLGIGAFVSVPLVGSNVKATEGSATVIAPLFGAEIALIGFTNATVRVTGSAGVALAWVRTSGFASAPYRGQTSNVTAALPFLGAEIAPRITSRTRLAIGGQVGASLPRVDIAFAGRTVATWGRPLGVLSAGVRIDL